MPSPLVRSTPTHGGLRLMSLVVLASIAVLAACDDNSLSGPGAARLITAPDGRTAGPSGLEQRLTARVEAPVAGSPYTAELVVVSVIVNTGSSPVSLTARECLFQDADIESTATMDRYEPLISCAAVSSARDIAPGQASGVMEVRFGVRSGPGTYTLRLRHALSPEFRGEVSFRVR